MKYLCLLLVVFLSGCITTGTPQKNSWREGLIENPNWYHGTKGVWCKRNPEEGKNHPDCYNQSGDKT